MKTLSCVLLAAASLVACQNDSKLDTKGSAPSGDLEARVKKLEADSAKHAEALDFLDKVYAQQKGQQEAQEREEPAPDAIFAVDIAQDLKAGQVEGPMNAPVTIVEAFDFACPYCRQVSDTLEALVKDYPGKVRVVFKNMVVHPQVATTAHLASCAAAKQGKYPQFKNALWSKGFDAYASARDPSKLGEDNVIAIAKDVGLDTDKLKTDMKSEDCKNFLENDRKELDKFHVNSTPTLFVNGTHVGGALPEQQFKTMIDEKLKLVEQSGVPAAEYYDKEIMGKGEKQFRSKKDPKPS
ncbi:MAG: thioredoxin domain-containing protein [Deltaproteobacteria bacterium]